MVLMQFDGDGDGGGPYTGEFVSVGRAFSLFGCFGLSHTSAISAQLALKAAVSEKDADMRQVQHVFPHCVKMLQQ